MSSLLPLGTIIEAGPNIEKAGFTESFLLDLESRMIIAQVDAYYYYLVRSTDQLSRSKVQYSIGGVKKCFWVLRIISTYFLSRTLQVYIPPPVWQNRLELIGDEE